MRKIKFTAHSALILQIAAGTEVEAIVQGGTLYAPVMSYPDTEGGTSEPSASPAASKPASTSAASAKPVTKPAAPKAKVEASELPTLKEMQAMTLPELLALAKQEGVNMDDLKAEHKVTRWSVVTLSKALDAVFAEMEGADAPEDGADVSASQMTAKKGGKKPSDPNKEEFEAIFNDLDGNAITEEEAVSRLTTLCDNEEVANEIVTMFMENDKLTVDDLYAEYESALEGSEAPKKPAKPAVKGSSKPAPAVGKGKDKSVEPEDLEVGDKIRGYWDSEEQWFEGEVVDIDEDSALPIIAWEDNTEGVLDTEEVSKLERL